MIEEEAEQFFDKSPPHQRPKRFEVFSFPPAAVLDCVYHSINEFLADISRLEKGLEGGWTDLFKKRRRSRYVYLFCRFCDSRLSLRDG
jgi:hypothetical protein